MRFVHVLLLSVVVAVASGATACNRIGNCEAQDTHGFSTTCSGPAGYVWTGSSCIYTRSCNCSGDDCGTMYSSQDICESTHAHCAP